MTDKRWLALWEQLCPQTAQRARILAGRGKSQALMALCENNPVVAAFGVAHAPAQVALEWDIWLGSTPASARHVPRHAEIAAVITHGTLKRGALARFDAWQQGQRRPGCHLLPGGRSPRAWLGLYRQALTLAGEDALAARPPALVLDIKSPWTTCVAISDLLQALQTQDYGFAGPLPVPRVASFYADQLMALPWSQRQLFTHGIEGVLSAGAGVAPRIFFNGGCMLLPGASGWRLSQRALRALRCARQDMELGFYVQEGHADMGALATLCQVANTYDTVFTAGFAYAGLPGSAVPATLWGAGVGVHRPSVWIESLRRTL